MDVFHTTLIVAIVFRLFTGTLSYSYELKSVVSFGTSGDDFPSESEVGSFASYASSVTDTIKGSLVLADDTYGCDGSNATIPVPAISFIVLLRLSACSDYLQAAKAQEEGASGVVFYYNPDSKSNLESDSSFRLLSQPVAVIALDDDTLDHVTGKTEPQYTYVSIGGVHYAVFQQRRTFLFIVTAFCILIVLSCVWFCTSYVKKCRVRLRDRRRQVSSAKG